jgi:hypothetical protein
LYWNGTTWAIGDQNITIGNSAGKNGQGSIYDQIAIGVNSAVTNQGNFAIAIGNSAGQTNQGGYSIAIGYQAGQFIQGNSIPSGGSIAIGNQAGQTNQGYYAIAIGNQAGQNYQGNYSIAIGYRAANSTQGTGAIAIGSQNGGGNNQGPNSVAIGFQSRNGSGTANAANSIVINANTTGLAVTGAGANAGFYVYPVNAFTSTFVTTTMLYNKVTYEIVWSNTGVKTFIIDHPMNKDKYLVHACLEGPEAGVYYRGIGKITNNKSETILLPDYVEEFETEFTIQVTKIYSEENPNAILLKASRVQGNSFNVYGKNCKFYWIVYGKRRDIEVEPLKAATNVKGSGPYKWI